MIKGLSSRVSERACNGHSTYVDSEILDVTKNSTFSEQASTGMFVPGFIVTYCQAKLLLAAPRPRGHHRLLGQVKRREHSSRSESVVVTKQLGD